MLFEVERASAIGRLTVRVHGEFDLSGAPTLGEYVDSQLSSGIRSLVIDLTGATFMDSSAARQLALITRRTTAAGVELQVVCPRDNRAVRLVVDLLELQTAVPIVESVRPGDGEAGPEGRR